MVDIELAIPSSGIAKSFAYCFDVVFLGGIMSSNDKVGFVGQSIFFEQISNAGFCRRVLARAALALADKGSDFPLEFADVLGRVPWGEYQTLLAMLSLRSSRVLCWTEEELESLRLWSV